LRDRFRKSKARARDPWLEGQSPAHPTQFEEIVPLEQVRA
jgi:hypothetical protein